MSAVLRKYKGKVVTQEELDVLVPNKPDWLEKPSMAANTYTEHDPLISEGCGVMKSQVKEARDIARLHSIQGMSVLDSGQIQFTSRKARKEWLSVRGLNDQDGGYSD
jgi:hypothetical protein